MGIRSKNIHRNSNVNRYRLIIGAEDVRLLSATAAPAEILVPIMDNSRLVEFQLGARGRGGADTGGVDVGLYLGTTATANALLTSATSRMATGEVVTGALATQSLNTAIILGPEGGMVISAPTFLLFDVNMASASHSVGGIVGALMFELDE